MHSAFLFNKHVNDFRQLLKTAYKCLPKQSKKKKKLNENTHQKAHPSYHITQDIKSICHPVNSHLLPAAIHLFKLSCISWG